ncbi:hypothetical protein F2Q68_00020791 [Brassica cretica]|uniref:Uncharacterized protein n=1 Tax=Brassica cretica TaxID=69181 RepID=A0A8S9FP74_BRACR|nr:hypothetical protein F2Q68_00020791 [Brassica cretica]
MIVRSTVSVQTRRQHLRPDPPSTSPGRRLRVDVSVQIRRRRLRLDPPSTSSSRSAVDVDVSVQIRCLHPDPRSIRDQDSKPQNVESSARITTYCRVCPFSSDKRYATTHVKAPPQLQKTGAVRVLPVSHGFVYEPYALHEKISWLRKCLYVTYGSLRSLYSTHELVGVSVAILNFFQRI